MAAFGRSSSERVNIKINKFKKNFIVVNITLESIK